MQVVVVLCAPALKWVKVSCFHPNTIEASRIVSRVLKTLKNDIYISQLTIQATANKNGSEASWSEIVPVLWSSFCILFTSSFLLPLFLAKPLSPSSFQEEIGLQHNNRSSHSHCQRICYCSFASIYVFLLLGCSSGSFGMFSLRPLLFLVYPYWL